MLALGTEHVEGLFSRNAVSVLRTTTFSASKRWFQDTPGPPNASYPIHISRLAWSNRGPKTAHWDEASGPGGKQACVEACPMQAIAFTDKVPTQIVEKPEQYVLQAVPNK